MKKIPLKKLFFSNAPLKIISLFFGYSFWYIASSHQTITITQNVPLYFSELNSTYQIQGPENIQIILQGTRSQLYTLDYNTLAAHVPTDNLKSGINGIRITGQNLFLPNTIKLVEYKPSNLTITLTKQEQGI
jgi:hypothetical protein